MERKIWDCPRLMKPNRIEWIYNVETFIASVEVGTTLTSQKIPAIIFPTPFALTKVISILMQLSLLDEALLSHQLKVEKVIKKKLKANVLVNTLWFDPIKKFYKSNQFGFWNLIRKVASAAAGGTAAIGFWTWDKRCFHAESCFSC